MSRRQSHRQRDRDARAAATATATALVGKSRRLDLLLLGGLVIGVAVYRFVVLAKEPGPPGSDPGNWLAYAQALFGASPKAAKDTMYFPGTLVLLKALLVFLAPLNALKTLAVVSSVAAGVPFYYLARRVADAWSAAFLTLLFLMTGFLIEMMNWGGYPQLLGTTFLLAALYFIDRWLVAKAVMPGAAQRRPEPASPEPRRRVEGQPEQREPEYAESRRDLAGAAIATALIFATHHFTVLILAASLLVYLPVVAWRQRADAKPFVRRCLLLAAAAGGLSLLTLPWYLQYMSYLAGNGSLNATGTNVHGLNNVISYLFSEAPLTWAALIAVVPALAMLPFGGRSASGLRPIVIALVVGPLVVFIATKEPRSLQPLQAGVLLALGILGRVAIDFLSRKEVSPTLRTLGRATLALAALALAFILLPNDHSRFEVTAKHYDAVDAQALQALDWLRDSTPPGTVVLPSDRSGWVNYSWWIEGFSQRPAYSLIEPRFLAFKEEQSQSAVAMKILDDATPPDEAEALLHAANIRYLFIYKPSGGAFQGLVSRIPVYISFQNDEFVILRVADAADTASAAHD